MKKALNKAVRTTDADAMRSEYDFTGGVRGKHFQAMRGGYTITIRRTDGTTIVKEVRPVKDAVILEPDVRKYFPDSKAVNRALRGLIDLMPKRRGLKAK